jgi:RsiW-degrading membrane proteinase PrsW (M82 family)
MPPGGHPKAPVSVYELQGALRMLVPIKRWVKDPVMRDWLRILVTVYAIVPLILEVVLAKDQDLATLGWAYCLYVAPLWALVFWYLIRPGKLTKLCAAIGVIVIAAEFVLIPALTVPWENAIGPSEGSHNLLAWIWGVGLAEEITKDLPVLVIAYLLVRIRDIRLDPRMWMFLASLSGLIFGAYEASTNYVPQALVTINHGYAFGILEFSERVFVDGLQHAVWAGMAGFFIGLGTNYRRQRIPLWAFGILVPSLLHGLNDWSVSGVFGADQWPWIAVQAFSLFLFLGYTTSARSIERDVRHTPLFRGDSIYLDPSQQQAPADGA